jgi:hypothetical protein
MDKSHRVVGHQQRCLVLAIRRRACHSFELAHCLGIANQITSPTVVNEFTLATERPILGFQTAPKGSMSVIGIFRQPRESTPGNTVHYG